ncbi:uncharacterized protein PHALS_08195 [Plasmopara halstedii]|uniref:Uncharacterized protein n=1 Tax=Plasmopara halstedii TaxID=4781 RepID=A0A0P1AC75_PLAHL|nr:uncharacterized protein PHALS_08195 [Plasmopara halstedii]CEG38101.1 hypothetical protein PHALS_08195 [Plasmopara halstedii]|eukprot:XP_024574470.1 hypothetical protein PHALS_08195 [Plasmopara halstedii]
MRHAPDKVVAVYELYQKGGADKVTKNLSDSRAYRKWSRYLNDAFSDNFKRTSMVEHGQEMLINSTLTTQVVRRELPLSNYFEDALIEFLANANGVQKEFADRLDDALFKYCKYLQKVDGSPKGLYLKNFKGIGGRIEGLPIFETTTNNAKDLVDDDTVHPMLSS